MNFKNFYKEDYEAVCDFLIELNLENKDHINWNWARFEWMMKHPEFDESLIKSIGLWMDGEKVVGAAIYDMYFGEAFCGVLPEYEALYPEILAYAYRELRDDNGLGIAICDESEKEIEAAKHAGFSLAEQTETVMSIGLNNVFGNKIEAEQNDYERLKNAGIRIPEMLDIDIENERIVKEYIDGETIFELVKRGEAVDAYLTQVREMAWLAKASGLNIDYFPTNFVVQDGLLWYIDYECNGYMDEWSFENWGVKYWSRTPEFEEYLNNH